MLPLRSHTTDTLSSSPHTVGSIPSPACRLMGNTSKLSAAGSNRAAVMPDLAATSSSVSVSAMVLSMSCQTSHASPFTSCRLKHQSAVPSLSTCAGTDQPAPLS